MQGKPGAPPGLGRKNVNVVEVCAFLKSSFVKGKRPMEGGYQEGDEQPLSQ